MRISALRSAKNSRRNTEFCDGEPRTTRTRQACPKRGGRRSGTVTSEHYATRTARRALDGISVSATKKSVRRLHPVAETTLPPQTTFNSRHGQVENHWISLRRLGKEVNGVATKLGADSGYQAATSGSSASSGGCAMRTTILASSFVFFCASTTFAQEAEDGSDVVLDPAQPHSPIPKDESSDDSAIASFTEAIRVDPKNACVYYYKRGIAWHNKGECDQAVADLVEAIRLGAHSGVLSGVRRSASDTTGVSETAVADLIKEPQDAPSFALRALAWWEKKDFDKAISDCDSAVRLDPRDAFSFCVRSWCWSEKEEYDKAIDDLTEAIRIDSKTANYFSFRAGCWVAKKEFDKAIEDCTQALKIDPTSEFAMVSRAACWVHKKEWDRAISDYSGAIEADPKDAGNFNCRGICWRNKGTCGEALYDFLQASIIDPKDAKVLNELAWLEATCPVEKYRHGQRAIEFATKACELSGWKEAAHIGTLAAACAETGEFDDAVRFQTKAHEMYSDELKAQWGFLLELYKSRKPYRDEPKK